MRSTRYVTAALFMFAAGCSADEGDFGPTMAQRASAGTTQTPVAGEPVVGDWPRWRGPNGDGISLETNWSANWTGAPETVWEARIGTGFSSFSIAADRLYTMGHSQGEDHVYCIDTANGQTLWTHSYPCELVDNLHEGGPAATPTLDGPHVYTISKEGHLFCLEASSGKVVWQKELQTELGVEMPGWGFSGSPLVWRELLIVEAGRTAALAKTTGELIWQTEKYRPGYGTPVAFHLGGKDLIAVLNNDALVVIQANDGSPIAQTKWETSYATSSTTPIVSNDTLFISTGYNRGCALLRLEGNKLEYVYENKDMSNHMNNCVLWQGHLYGFDGNSHDRRNVTLNCMEHASGEIKWEERGLGCGSLMIADGKLIILSDEGELVTAEASPEKFTPISRAKILGGKCWTVPVLAGGQLFARNADGDLVRVDLSK